MFGAETVATGIHVVGIWGTVLSIWVKYSALRPPLLWKPFTVSVCGVGLTVMEVHSPPTPVSSCGTTCRPPSLVSAPPSGNGRPLGSSSTTRQYGSHGLSMHVEPVPRFCVRCRPVARLSVATRSPMQAPHLPSVHVRCPIEHDT